MLHDWLIGLTLAGFLGRLGQGLRVIAGLKKMNDDLAASQKSVRSELEPGRLLTSLLIGFIAGCSGFLLMDINLTQPISRDMVYSLMGMGYAGTDAIEAFIRKTPIVKS